MSIADTLLPEFDQEMATTRRLLERVPSDKGKWKPHEKSFSLGHLAQLVAWMPGWIGQTLRERELNLKAQSGYSYEKTEDLISMFDKNPPADVDLLVVDECQHDAADSMAHIHNVVKPKMILGLTATPFRSDRSMCR